MYPAAAGGERVRVAGQGMKLLERDELLTTLQALLRHAAAGQGALLFLEGEAGIGKTSLLRAFAASLRADLPVYWGECDAMQTPRSLGPLFDIAAHIEGELLASLQVDGERLRIFDDFLAALGRCMARARLSLRGRACVALTIFESFGARPMI